MIHEDFNQIAAQPSIGVTFGTILRNILRQDPDVIMIGEMRDLETAENAVQAALTGHLVLSTLHTNDAPSSITRLLDIGIPPFLVQSTLVGILSQRLIRKICPHCIEHFEMEAAELRAIGLDMAQNVFEVIPYTESLKKLTTGIADLEAITSQAKKEGMVTLRENAKVKLLEGKTTYQEVQRVTWAHQ